MSIASASLSAGGLGRLPIAPGTWASFAVAVVVGALLLLEVPLMGVNATLVTLGVLGSLACIAWGEQGEALAGKKDPGWIVADEVAGQCVALLALPWRPMHDSQGWLLNGAWWNGALLAVAFFAFRGFDIVKPPPIHGLQRIKGGLGILADDLAAGLAALLVTQAVAWWTLPRPFPLP